MKFSILLALALSYTTLSSAQGQNFRPGNADKAEQLTKEFAKLTKDSPCENNAQACVEDQFAQCVGGKFQLNSCGGGELKCVVLPLVNKPGTSITCSTEADRLARLADARKGNGNDVKAPDNEKAPGNGKENDVKVPDNEKAPGNGKEKAPGKGKDGEAPGKGKDGEAPGKGKDGEAPGKGKDGEAPGKGKDGEAPGKGKDGEAPGKGKDGEAPGKGKDGEAPGKGKDGEAPPDQGKNKDGKLPPDNLCKCPPPNNDGGNGDNNGDNKDGGNGDNNGDNKDGGNGGNNGDNNGDNKDGGNDNKDGQDGKAPTDGENGKAPSDNDKLKTPPANGDGNNNQDKLKTPPANGDGNLADIRKQNAADAKALQKKFDTLKPDDKCNDNEVACVDNKFAQCSGGKFAITECASGTICAALPLVLKKGTTVACTTEADRDARLKQAETNTK